MLGNLNGSVTVGVLPVKQLFQLTELLQSGQSSYSQGNSQGRAPTVRAVVRAELL